VEVLAQRLAQGRGVSVGGSHEPARLEAGELQHASPRVHGAARLLRIEPNELGFAVGTECTQRLVRPARQAAGTSTYSHGAQMLKAMLGDRITAALALGQPVDHLR
jgi:hypothetical protein